MSKITLNYTSSGKTGRETRNPVSKKKTGKFTGLTICDTSHLSSQMPPLVQKHAHFFLQKKIRVLSYFCKCCSVLFCLSQDPFCNPNWPGTCSVKHIGLELTEICSLCTLQLWDSRANVSIQASVQACPQGPDRLSLQLQPLRALPVYICYIPF